MIKPHSLCRLALVAVLFSGCTAQSDQYNAAESDSVQAVRKVLENTRHPSQEFQEVAIRGGVAVLVDDLGAFWVKDGRVYALNGLAKSFVPGLSYGPPGLSKSDVRRALRGEHATSKADIVSTPPTRPLKPPVKCDRFGVQLDQLGEKVGIKLVTDLPESTVIMVSVSRGYREVGSGVDYSIDYLSGRYTVREWAQVQYVSISDQAWYDALRKRLSELEPLGLGFRVASTKDVIDVRIVVPVNQAGPIFDEDNANLEGAAVYSQGSHKHVSVELEVIKPLKK